MRTRDLIEQARAVPIEIEIARRGMVVKGGIDRCGPCPVCGGTDRFAVNVRKQLFLCRGCRVGGDVITMVQHLDHCSFAEAVETLTGAELRRTVVPSLAVAAAKKKSVEEYEREQHRKAAWLWSSRQPIAGTPAERYLRSRGITCPLPATLGFLPARGEHPAAMIAVFGLCDEPEPGLIVPQAVPQSGQEAIRLGRVAQFVIGKPSVGAVHLTKLRPDGRGKADVDRPKIVIGSPKIALPRQEEATLPIVLAPANDLLGLAVTEGIEDGLTAHQTTGLGVWAAGNAVNMPKLAALIPGYVECVTIHAHPDVAGQDAAQGLAQTLDQRGIEVRIDGWLR